MSPRKARLLFIVTKGRLDSSAHKRVYDLLPFLQKLGYEVTVVSYKWERLSAWRLHADLGSRLHRFWLRELNRTRLMPLLSSLRALFTRKRLTRLVQWADIVIVNQTPLDDNWRLILETAKQLVYDIDDAIYLKDSTVESHFMPIVIGVVAGNQYLRDWAVRSKSFVRVIPTTVRLDRYMQVQRRTRSNSITIGWIGSPFTTRYLSLLVEPLARLGQSHALTLELVGTGAAELPSFRNITVKVHQALPYDPVDFVPNFDIGVMPLFDAEFERAKCGAKALEYMAAGIPAVCSAVGTNHEIIQSGENGFLVESEQDWIETLEALILSPEVRQRVGRAARTRVAEAYSSEHAAKLWHEVCGRLLSQTPNHDSSKIQADHAVRLGS